MRTETTSPKAGERTLKLNRGKYAIIGSEGQVAATESKSNLNLVRRIFAPARFSNGCRALVVQQVATKKAAAQWLNRSNVALAFVSGRLGRWITPTFVIVESSEINYRNSI